MKKILFVLPLSIAALVACGGSSQDSKSEATSSSQATSTSQATSSGQSSDSGVAPGETVSLVDPNSRLIGTPKPNPEAPGQTLPMKEQNILTGLLPTYHHKDKGDVAYVTVAGLAKAIDDAFPLFVNPGLTTENKTDGYRLYSADRKGEIIFDAANDIIKIKNGQSFVAPSMTTNNGIVGDYVNYRGKAVKESSKTKVYKENGGTVEEYDTFDFKKYNFDIVTLDNKCYVPFEAFCKVLFRDISLDVTFNGKDYFTNRTNESFLASLAYSSNGYFQAMSGIYAPSKNKGENEVYRFESTTKRPSEEDPTKMEECTRFLVLNEGGAGYSMLCRGKELNPSKAVEDPESSYVYVWRKDGNLLKIDVTGDNVEGTLQVHLDETRVFSSKVSNAISQYNYDILRFIFDTSYGLKDIKGYTDAPAFFKAAGVDDGLKSTNLREYNTAMSKLIGYIDDGHTGFNNMSHYSDFAELDNGGEYTTISRSGQRLTKLIENGKKYLKERMETYKKLNPQDQNPEDPNFYQGIKFSSNKDTAIIAFNGFANNYDEILTMKDVFPDPATVIDEDNFNIVTRGNLIASTPKGFLSAFKILDQLNKDTKVVKNVVVDMTTNGGGEIAIMPFLTAFFAEDPTFTIKDVTNGVTKEFHYEIDLDGDGKFGDTYKGKFNFYFLTSGFSFSCGNCLPGMVKEGGVKIIGETSGGGTSPVGAYFDGLGTYFNLSSHFDMCYKADGKYVQNDAGIPLDYAFPYEDGNWYDPNKVATFINGLN